MIKNPGKISKSGQVGPTSRQMGQVPDHTSAVLSTPQPRDISTSHLAIIAGNTLDSKKFSTRRNKLSQLLVQNFRVLSMASCPP